MDNNYHNVQALIFLYSEMNFPKLAAIQPSHRNTAVGIVVPQGALIALPGRFWFFAQTRFPTCGSGNKILLLIAILL